MNIKRRKKNMWNSKCLNLNLKSNAANGFLILIMLRKKKLNDITNCYIFSLSMSDLMFTLFCIPFTAYVYIRHDWQLGSLLCKMNHFLSSSSVHASGLTLAAMVYHRANRIIKQKTSNKNTLIMHRRRKCYVWRIAKTKTSAFQKAFHFTF